LGQSIRGIRMPKPKLLYILLIFLIATVSLLLQIPGPNSTLSARQANASKPDIVTIDSPPVSGQDTMPAVQFIHGLHNQTVGGDCSACHMEKDGSLVFTFKRLEKLDAETTMTLYHDNCTSCHIEKKKAGGPSGPMTGECRKCHSIKQKIEPVPQPVAFNRSLHYRHEQAKHIKPEPGSPETNCRVCHHQYNPETKKLY